jgi:hypothetical protein
MKAARLITLKREDQKMKAIAERLFSIAFYFAFFFVLYWAIHYLTGWTPSLRR